MLKSAIAYFALVFGAGFVLGVVRTLWLVPYLGERNSELLETPFMIAVVFVAAKFVVRRMTDPTRTRRAMVGLVALALLIAAELSVVVWVRDQSLSEYASSRDPLSGAVYLIALLVFAAAPGLVGRSADR